MVDQIGGSKHDSLRDDPGGYDSHTPGLIASLLSPEGHGKEEHLVEQQSRFETFVRWSICDS